MKPFRKSPLPAPLQLVNLICFCPLNPHLLEGMNPEFPGHSLSSALRTPKLSGFIAFVSRIRIFQYMIFSYLLDFEPLEEMISIQFITDFTESNGP